MSNTSTATFVAQTDCIAATVNNHPFDNLDSIYLAHASKLHEVAATIRGTGRPNDALTIRYYDVEAGGWRSFKVENLVTVY